VLLCDDLLDVAGGSLEELLHKLAVDRVLLDQQVGEVVGLAS